MEAEDVRETVGTGNSGVVGGERYVVARCAAEQGMSIGLFDEHGETPGIFRFEEEIKADSQRVVRELTALGFHLFVVTGDRRASAERVVGRLGADIEIRAECIPEDKQLGLAQLRRAGRVVAMVGDDIDDAPALAQANVGMVFSDEEQTASSEAADVIFLDGDLVLVKDAIRIARGTIRIALQYMQASRRTRYGHGSGTPTAQRRWSAACCRRGLRSLRPPVRRIALAGCAELVSAWMIAALRGRHIGHPSPYQVTSITGHSGR